MPNWLWRRRELGKIGEDPLDQASPATGELVWESSHASRARTCIRNQGDDGASRCASGRGTIDHHVEQGEPDFDTPNTFARRAVAPSTRVGHDIPRSPGSSRCESHRSEAGTRSRPPLLAGEITVGCGAKQVIFNACERGPWRRGDRAVAARSRTEPWVARQWRGR